MLTHIIHIVHLPRSGIGTIVRQLIAADASSTYRYSVILLETDAESEAQFLSTGAEVHGYSLSAHPVATLRAITSVLRNASIIHLHSFLPQLAAFLCSQKRAKYIRTIHNDYPYFHDRDIRSSIKRAIEGLIIRADHCHLICVSKDLPAALPWKNHKLPCAVIENGISVPSPAEIQNSTPASLEKPRGFVIVALGRMEKQKGFDILVDAFNLARQQLQKRAQSEQLYLWIIGDGSCHPFIEQKIHAYALSDYVSLPGYQINPYPFLSFGNALAMPSRHEGFGLSAAEGMLLGLPVILSQFGGIASQLTHGLNAHIVEKENTAELADALVKLATKPDYCAQLAKEGTAFAKAHYSIEKCLPRYLDIYSLYA